MKKRLLALTVTGVTALLLAACGGEKIAGRDPGFADPQQIGKPIDQYTTAAGGSESEQDQNTKLLHEVQEILQANNGWESVSYTYTVQVEDSTIVAAYRIKNNKIRIAKKDQNGNESITYYDTATGENIFYVPAEKEAYRSRHNSEDIVSETPWAYLAWLKNQTLTVSGQEKINDTDCTVVHYSDSDGDYTMWIDPNLAIPVKVRIKNVEGSDIIATFTNISTKTLQDADLTLPSDIRIVDENASGA